LGRRLPDASVVFQNIPFAQPPVANLRWREPQPPTHWNGVRDATKPSATCLQTDLGRNHDEAKDGSEDCLYLNVSTPSWPIQQKLPVMVWIHGGSNYFGSGRVRVQTLTGQGVVFVSINYRLGIFGFLSHPELTRESPHHGSGNYAILDQIAALRWVKKNIAAFGGDPKNVTVFGQSAGAIDIGMLLVSPLSRGLFSKAICESGGPLPPQPLLPTLKEAEKMGEAFAAILGKPTHGSELNFLRSAPAKLVLDAGYRNTAPGPNGSPTQGSWLAVDGWVIPEQPALTLRSGRVARVPVIIGSNVQEFSSTAATALKPEELRKHIRKEFGAESSKALEFYGMASSDHPAADPFFGSSETQFMTDTWFRCPSIVASGWLSNAGNPVWQYQFERPLPGTEASSTVHSGELPYVFGEAQIPGKSRRGAFETIDGEISRQIQAYWLEFARRDDPNSAKSPVWPKYDESANTVIHFTSSGPVVTPNPRVPFCSIYKANLESGLRE
jgi:para-nitrobenzyl esterase